MEKDKPAHSKSHELRKRDAEAIRGLVTAGAGLFGQSFFEKMVRYLGKILSADYIFIAENESPETVRTIAVCAKGGIAENFSYPLAGTPCENVAGKKFCFHPEGVANAFPADGLLSELSAEGYAGVPLFDSRGRTTGLIVALTSRPLTDMDFFVNALQLAGARTAAELERSGMERALRESEKKYREFIEGSDDLAVRVDAGGNILYVNHVAERIYGLPPGRCTGISTFDFIHPEDREASRAAFKRWVDEKRTSTAHENRLVNRENGKIRHMLWTVNLTYDRGGRLTGVNGIARDLTARKEVEERISRMNRELEERVEERSARLIDAGEALKRSVGLVRETRKKLILSERMAMLGEMVAGSTHEINTPLGIGITTVSHLDNSTKEIEKLYRSGRMTRSNLENYLELMGASVDIVYANLKRSAELVRSLKVVAVDQCTDDRRRFRLKEYLDEIMRSLGPSLMKTSHSVEVNCPETLELDSYPGALSQIITNLAMNSLKHGFENRENGEIRIDVKEEGEQVRIRFRDNGRGIEEENLTRIFDEFFTTKRMDGGSGLGTSIVFSLVRERLKGHIRCKSIPGRGTTFSITIPKDPAAA